MKNYYIWMLVLLLALFGISCSNGKNEVVNSYSKEQKRWEKLGWKFKETLGAVGAFEAVTHLKSETAKSVGAFWILKGQKNKKFYVQDKFFYLVLIFQKNDGDSFVVVMIKRK